MPNTDAELSLGFNLTQAQNDVKELEKLLKDASKKIEGKGFTSLESRLEAAEKNAKGLSDELSAASTNVSAIADNLKELSAEKQATLTKIADEERGLSKLQRTWNEKYERNPDSAGAQKNLSAQAEQNRLIKENREYIALIEEEEAKLQANYEKVETSSQEVLSNYAQQKDIISQTLSDVELSVNANQELAQSTKEEADNVAIVKESLDGAKDSAQSFAQSVKEISNGSTNNSLNNLAQSSETATEGVENLASAAERAQFNVARISEAMETDTAGNNLAELIRRLNTLKQAQADLKKANMPEQYDAVYNNASKMIAQLNVQISAYKRNLLGAADAHKKLEKSSGNLKNTASLLSTIRRGFKDWNKDTTKIKHSFDSMAKAMKSNLKHLITSVTKYVLGFRSLFFLIRRLRKYIGEGIKNMAQFNDGSNHVNASITRLLSSLLYLKNAWATAFSPILQFVTPWLEALIDKIAQVGNAFSRFLGSLLGQTQVFQAVKVKAADYADGLDNVGGSAGSAADKTKKLTDRLAAFDDLNVLGVDKDPDGTGRGGGGGAGYKYTPNPNDMFKLVSVADTVKQKLAEMWSKADFEELGYNLAQQVKMALLDLNSRWSEIKDTAEKVGRSFGTFLTGVFSDPSVFEELGKAVAEGLNTVGRAIEGFFDTYQKGSIGTSIAEYFNGLFSNIDWTTAGKNVGSAFSTLFTEISSFFENLDYDELQKSLTDFFSGIDWGEVIGSGIRAVLSSTFGITKIASSIIIGLSDAINNTDFNELVSDIEEAIKQIDPEELVDTLATFIESVAKSLGASAKLIGAIAVAIFNLIKAGVEEMTTTFMEANDIDENTEDIGGKIVAGVLQGITWAMEGIGEWVSTNFIEPFIEAVTGKNGFDMHSPSKVSEQWGVWIVEGLKNGIASIIETVMEPFTKLQGDLATKWTEIKISASEKWTEIKDKLSEKANDIKSKLSEVWTNIKGDAATAWVMLRVSAVQAFEQLKEALKRPINGVISVVESMVNRIIDGINSIVTKINNIPDIKFTNPFTGTDYKLGFNIPKLSNISIPRLAQGAVIPPNREFMAVLGDQSHGTNVEAPLDTIKQAVADVMANNGNAEVIQLLQQLIGVVERKELTIGDKEIGKANARYVNQQRLIRGTSF